VIVPAAHFIISRITVTDKGHSYDLKTKLQFFMKSQTKLLILLVLVFDRFYIDMLEFTMYVILRQMKMNYDCLDVCILLPKNLFIVFIFLFVRNTNKKLLLLRNVNKSRIASSLLKKFNHIRPFKTSI